MSTTKEQFTIKGIHGDSTMIRATYEDYQRALKSRRALGRYTLEEAALFVCEQQTGEHPGNAKKILKMLMDGARAGTLQIYNPDSRCPRSKEDAQQVWHAIEEAYWSDLNEWIRVNAKFLDCKFPDPDAPAAVAHLMPANAPAKDEDATTQKRQRRDALAVELDEILSETPTLKPSKVKSKLLDRIGKQNSQIVGNTSGGLQWENNDGYTIETTYRNIDKRITRWKMLWKSQHKTPA